MSLSFHLVNKATTRALGSRGRGAYPVAASCQTLVALVSLQHEVTDERLEPGILSRQVRLFPGALGVFKDLGPHAPGTGRAIDHREID